MESTLLRKEKWVRIHIINPRKLSQPIIKKNGTSKTLSVSKERQQRSSMPPLGILCEPRKSLKYLKTQICKMFRGKSQCTLSAWWRHTELKG